MYRLYKRRNFTSGFAANVASASGAAYTYHSDHAKCLRKRALQIDIYLLTYLRK